MNDSERQDLFAAAVAGELTPEDGARLLAECRRNPLLARQLAASMTVDRLLHAVESDPAGEFAAQEVTARIEGEKAPLPEASLIVRVVESAYRLLWFKRLAWAGAFATMLLTLAGAGVWTAKKHAAIGTLARVEGVTWRGAEPGATLKAGERLVAERGLFELRFDSGVKVVVEAPADLEIEAANRVHLYAGKAVARVPKRGRGFTLDSPRGRLVDLGTEFGVSVGKNGATEVHVLDGVVEASLNRSAPVLLRESEAMRASNNATKRMHADEGAFVTSLPPLADRPPGFIHWSFNDESEQAFPNTGQTLGETGDTRLFPKFLPPEAGAQSMPGEPALVPGPFGKGIYFNGVNAYAESPYPGIAGRHPRTIAFWVKVPKDFNKREGYGIVSWGSFNVEGAAWQISANPADMAGELGRLRVGTKSGFVVGTTDLRDDRWHHCAVVMYGGNRPTTGTHVLLYVDGQIEPSPRKSVQEISTIPSGRHGVWLGRNLAFASDQNRAVSIGNFFRGSVAEVYIFDGALSQRDIESLRVNNTPP